MELVDLIMVNSLDNSESKPSKLRSRDRILQLEIIDGKKPLSSIGITDSRLFNGNNRMHAISDEQTGLWYFKYEQGLPPQELRCKFTSFKMMLKFATDYYLKRNIRIAQVID